MNQVVTWKEAKENPNFVTDLAGKWTRPPDLIHGFRLRSLAIINLSRCVRRSVKASGGETTGMLWLQIYNYLRVERSAALVSVAL